MDLKEFLEKTEPEALQKLAADAQDEMVSKVVDALFPLLEKTANYTAYLVLEKLAEDNKQQEQPKEEAPKEAPKEEGKEAPKENKEVAEIAGATKQNAEVTADVNEVVNTDPAGSGKSNQSMDPSVTPGGLKAQEIKDAIAEAIEVGQADKILTFVKAVASQYPDTVNEVIKMVKVELHDGIMKKLVDEETAVSITDQLNAMVGA